MDLEGRRTVFLKADSKVIKLDFGDGIFLDGKLYRIMGRGVQPDDNEGRIRTFDATLSEENSPQAFGKKGRLFSTIELDQFILPDP